MTPIAVFVGIMAPVLLLIGKAGLVFALWRLVSEVATTVRYYRRFIQ